MTLKDVFAHFMSWRWQAISWGLCAIINVVIGQFLGNSIGDCLIGALVPFAVLNVFWTYLKACILADINPFALFFWLTILS